MYLTQPADHSLNELMSYGKRKGMTIMAAAQAIYQQITDQIIAKLEAGVVPWQKPWNAGDSAVSWLTQKPYRGVNQLLLTKGEYATFNQVRKSGGHVKKGGKATRIIFWSMLERKNKETGETDRIPFPKIYHVFEINGQCEGLGSKRKAPEESAGIAPIEAAQKIAEGYLSRGAAPVLRHEGSRAYYRPSADRICMPSRKDFKKAEGYYETLFHEMTHSTGHASRLKRDGITDVIAGFGSVTYSKEELVAEIGTAMLCGVAGISDMTIDNSAAYIGSWLKALKDDNRLIISAASKAQKAADYILGIKYDGGEAAEDRS